MARAPGVTHREKVSTGEINPTVHDKPIDQRAFESGGVGAAFEETIDSDVETMAGTGDFQKIMSEESFMEEELEITLPPQKEDSERPYVEVMVNGKRQFMPKGPIIKVRRKYVEVLARMKETEYDQRQTDPTQPDSIQLVPRTRFVHNFVVHYDPRGDIGAAWLRKIMAERA